MEDIYFEKRKEKLKNWESKQVAYPGKFERTGSCMEIGKLLDGTGGVSVSGRLMAFRGMGKIAFANIQDGSGRLQISLQVDQVGKEEFSFISSNLDVGDHIGVSGTMYTTRKGEKTLQVEKLILLSKSLRTLPEKFHGIRDPELKARYRFLDLMMNSETRKRFQVRANLVRFIRNFLNNHQFIEVETPILQAASSGASARPFITHHNALDMPLYLRIAPETYLKRLIAGGYDRVFEIGKCFRNEGIDPSHLQEFTMLEFYAAYWDYRDNMKFIKNLIQEMLMDSIGSHQVVFEDQTLDFSGEWPEITYRDLVLKYTGIDLDQVDSLKTLQAKVLEKNLDLPLDKYVGLGGLMDGLYKRYCRPHLIQPVFLTKHPAELVPLARRSDDNSKTLDMFQVVVNSWEVVKAYSELVDPIEQKARMLEQLELAKAGDDEAMMLEEDFILAMEYGMPPISGLGLGIDRFAAFLTNSQNIRDLVYFPSLRASKDFENLEGDIEGQTEK
ncbi:MAG: lysine--tRNA ligase [Bdellovibrionales bacterium]|nr:lysine--tRNA ligase [Bdellovibrionales bacterium]